ncbi:MAG TPA: protein kinase, partial [Acidobacteriota bacterium]|nr:protein kinase [Acidobacteriota bacterium]
KPANIMITPAAQVKVLDFGLAKTYAYDEEGSQPVSSITQTQSGVVLGTVHYMSPEQAMGEPVDHRSDIFSLGIVLYEMIFGKRPFSGPNPQAVLHQVLSLDPQSTLPPGSAFPADMEFIIAKCLRKAPAERYQSIADLIADLSVIQRRVTGEGSGKVTLGEKEYNLSRQTARILFVVLQSLYLVFYVCALRWNEGMDLGLKHILGDSSGQTAFLLLLVTAPVGIAVRLYLISTVMLDHVSTGVRYRKAFPVYFLLDILWSLSPFGLALKIGEWMALACIPPLVFSPFAQRTLVRSAYDLYAPRRFSTAA